MTSFSLQLDRDPSPRRSHKLPALVRDHELDTAKRSSNSGTEELEETEENSLPAISPTLALKMSFTIFSIDSACKIFTLKPGLLSSKCSGD